MSIGAFVSARDYRDYNGFGTASPEEVMQLQKALYAGQDVNAPAVAPGEGFPLRTESLENQLKNLSFEMDEIKLFRTIPKVPASNTVEEFNRLRSYSEATSRRFNAGWMTEGDLPEEVDSTYERVTVLIKFLGVVGRVTHVANTIRAAHGNVIALETMNKTMELLKNVEHAIFFGDSSLLPEQFDGLESLIIDGAPDNVIDLRGQPLTEEVMNDAMLLIRDNYGAATDAYFATGPYADLAKQVFDRQRFLAAPAPGVLGATVTAFQGQHGRVNLHDHVFFNNAPTPAPSGLGRADRRPLPPTLGTATAAGTGSKFTAPEAGAYLYKVVAGNRYGVSAPVTLGAAVTVAAGESITIPVTDGGQGTSYYEVYRTPVGGAADSAEFMVRVPRSAASQNIVDANEDLPGTTKGFVLMQNQQSFSWSQLLPLTRIPLAAIDTSIRWAQVLYGAVKMYTPAKNVVFKNIGRVPGSVESNPVAI